MRELTVRLFLAASVCTALISVVACGPSAEEEMAAQQVEAYAALETAQAELFEARQRLNDLEAQVAAAEGDEGEGDDEAEAAEGAEGEGGETAAADPAAELASLRNEVTDMTDAFGMQLVDFINNAGILEGEEMTPEQIGAIRMKSAEDMVLATEYIEKGGDYRRAIDIYQNALAVDPDNEELKTALAMAEEMRFMTEERFAQVKKGMSETEVRDLLGSVNLRNIRDYASEGRDVIAWFYPREDGGAAAVWFRPKDGENSVYQLNYSEVKPPEEQEEGS